MKTSIFTIITAVLSVIGISSCDDSGQKELLKQAQKEVERAEKRADAVSVLNNARQIQLAMMTYALEKEVSGASHHWPTEEANSKYELKTLLVNGEFFTKADFDKLTQNLLIGKVSKEDSEDTIVAISDNIPDSPVEASKQIQLDKFVFITKGGKDGAFPVSSYNTIIKTYRMPSLIEN